MDNQQLGHCVYVSFDNERAYIGRKTYKNNYELDNYFGSYSDKTFRPNNKIILGYFESEKEVCQAEYILQWFLNSSKEKFFANKCSWNHGFKAQSKEIIKKRTTKMIKTKTEKFIFKQASRKTSKTRKNKGSFKQSKEHILKVKISNYKRVLETGLLQNGRKPSKNTILKYKKILNDNNILYNELEDYDSIKSTYKRNPDYGLIRTIKCKIKRIKTGFSSYNKKSLTKNEKCDDLYWLYYNKDIVQRLGFLPVLTKLLSKETQITLLNVKI